MRHLYSALGSALLLSLIPIPSLAQPLPSGASARDKYENLIQVLPCPSDRAKYGNFNDYGYWGGGNWCGQQGSAGFWVWQYPNWYVWGQKRAQSPSAEQVASVGGKYATLLQVLNCPRDRAKYGNFHDYGYWPGGDWCGKQGVAGHWVWVAPDWYVWRDRR
ncbi:MAG: hypothetical protein SFT94_11260 [Pseudanabaenaceae cyanobacterium bins.68]|nr:hypothetical protein [Pseudanabaenaceae cyanobacterium bins.68]